MKQEEYNPNNIEQNIRLPGQHHDKETGLYYNRYRYYDPKIGAYINQDPIGLDGSHNWYSYPSNPLLLIDPTGLSFWSVIKTLFDWGSTAKTANDGANAVDAVMDYEKAAGELRDIREKLSQCTEIPAPKGLNCPALEQREFELNKEITKNKLPKAAIGVITTVPGTSATGPLVP
jgi:RHS repeat-associated protein